MKYVLPRNYRELFGLFKDGSLPALSDFEGEYEVDVPTVLPSLKMLSHRKVFYRTTNGVHGCNVFFKDMRWGRFFLEEGICRETGSKVLVINYGVPDNSFLTRPMRDHIVAVGDGLYLGRLNYMLLGELRFLAYFSLKKIVAR